jgi:hypothetical protein
MLIVLLSGFPGLTGIGCVVQFPSWGLEVLDIAFGALGWLLV